MKRLTEIGLKHNTDKAYEHSFTEVYDDFFKNYTDPRILEIGTYNGGSVLTYNEYFNYQCEILGVDNGSQLGFLSNHPNITIKIADQDRPQEIVDVADGQWDIILDDGSHFVEHQINCFHALISKVKPGGIYIIEDLHSNLHPHYNPNNVQTCIEFLQNLKFGEGTPYKGVSVFCEVPLSEATNLSHITSVIELW